MSWNYQAGYKRETLNWLRNNNNTQLFSLQEVHCSKESEKFWLAEWGYRGHRGLFSSLSSSRAKFNNNFSSEILKYFSDLEGRFITADIKTEDKIITLQNIYAPNNNDDPNFFKSVFNKLSTFEWNTGFKAETTNEQRKTIPPILSKENIDVTDIWPNLHPNIQRFTWRRNKPETHRRSDFFKISSSLSTDGLEADIQLGFKTDYSLITLSLSTKTNPRRPGFLKL